ncbi:MAG: dynamin family protein [Ilumatobacteraceae bacterium]
MSTPEAANGATSMERATRGVLRDALNVYADEPDVVVALEHHLGRLDAPLRVAVAGKMKAGKSTLLNALIGEEIAPTDASECTRVVTWYEHGPRPRITLHPSGGPARELPLRRPHGRLALDLGGEPAEQVDRLHIEWPSRSLRAATLIDTPGIDSLTAGVSSRTTSFLTPDDEPSAADAIIYLLRHLHAADVHFLESFHDTAPGRATMVNAIGVLSRADEIGAGRIDALLSARAVAARYRQHPVVRQLCSTVVPVAGLLAQAGRTLRQSEYLAIEALAGCPRDSTEDLLISVDRFVRPDAPVPVDVEQRTALLDRLGLFGVRLGVTFVRAGMRDASALAAELARRSGLDEVRRLLAVQFSERSALLKSRSALLGVERVLRDHPRPDGAAVGAEVERIMAGAHELRELALLAALRASRVDLSGFGEDANEDAERLLGATGTSANQRLGLDAGAPEPEARAAALDAARVWRTRAASELFDPETIAACQVVVRSCEGLIAEL